MNLLKVGVSGLLTHQAALQTTGHNISNTDTPGFSRQTVRVGAAHAEKDGPGFSGMGSVVTGVDRIVDEYLVNQVRLDASAFGELESFLSNVGQIDILLADATSGIAPAIQDFAAALHAAADDPSSLPVRQLVLSQGESLVRRFETVNTQLRQQNEAINKQLGALATEVTDLGIGIASYNNAITLLASRAQGGQPNDLIDGRDRLLGKLAELVSVNVVDAGRGKVDVYVGKGQALVSGNQALKLDAVRGQYDPARFELAFVNGGGARVVSSAMTGGEIGGLVEFRERGLDTTFNAIGRLALGISETFNAQHRLGLDLDSRFGGNLFAEANDPAAAAARVQPATHNAAYPPEMSVVIDDLSQLTTSEYKLEMPGPGALHYVLTRLNDNVEVARGALSGAYPDSISADGFSLHVGGPLNAGDRFRVSPTRFGASEMAFTLKRPEQLALASAISAEASLANGGTGTVTATAALDLDGQGFLNPGDLNPPLVIRFTSPTTYDVLDNTNPARPRDLVPPLRGLTFTPGITNQLLPTNPGQMGVVSEGALAGRLPAAVTLAPQEGVATNGYTPETLRISTTDVTTGIVSRQAPVEITAVESASSVAARLNAATGVRATARSEVVLHSFVNAEAGPLPAILTINGVVAADAGLGLLNANSVADNIAANEAFEAMGIVARSDGERLTIESLYGDDIRVGLRGDESDSVIVGDRFGAELLLPGAGDRLPAVMETTADLSAGYNFDIGGPYTMTVAVGYAPAYEVRLSGRQVLGRDVVRTLQNALDDQRAPTVTASMLQDGRIALTTLDAGSDAALSIVDISPALATLTGLTLQQAKGAISQNEVAVGGTVDVFLEEGVRLTSNVANESGSLFVREPVARPTWLGYQVELHGNPERGDSFAVEFNRNGVSDSRNAASLIALSQQGVLGGGNVTLFDAFGSLIEDMGALTAQTRINRDASQGLLEQSQSLRDGVSGVNLDEEAANLIRFELGYNASAQVISVARGLFDTLLNSIG